MTPSEGLDNDDGGGIDGGRAVRRLLIGALVIGFLALIAAGVIAWRNTDRNRQHVAIVEHTYAVQGAINRLQIALEQTETARRGYLLSGAQLFSDGYRANTSRVPLLAARIRALTRDNPRQLRNLALVDRQLEQLAVARTSSMARVRDGGRAAAVTHFLDDPGFLRLRALRGRLTAMLAEEDRLLVIRTSAQAVSGATFLAALGVAGALIAAVALLSLLTVLRYIRDLGRSLGRLTALTESLEDTVRERTADLTRANDEIQRFAYIVSHDLRSPLVNVMGFTAELESGIGAVAELVDRAEASAPALLTDEARVAAREDMPEAIGFIRASTAKMDRLINAILKLAREGRRTIAPERLDIAAMIDGIRDTLRYRLDERGATITVPAQLPAIVSDRLAIEQVFANLIENAVKYLDPARPGRIEVRGRMALGRAMFEVVDNGRGIDPRDHERVFDLFRRSGQQDQPGEGIGLAHVRALTYRLGGTIDVASQLGQGATFRLSLPVNLAELSGPEA